MRRSRPAAASRYMPALHPCACATEARAQMISSTPGSSISIWNVCRRRMRNGSAIRTPIGDSSTSDAGCNTLSFTIAHRPSTAMRGASRRGSMKMIVGSRGPWRQLSRSQELRDAPHRVDGKAHRLEAIGLRAELGARPLLRGRELEQRADIVGLLHDAAELVERDRV